MDVKLPAKFVTLVVHELKSPLGAIEGYLRLMQERGAGAKLEDYDAMIGRCIERSEGMRTLINDLLEMLRVRQGGVDLGRELTELPLATIAAECAAATEGDARRRGITISIDVPDGLTMTGDRREVRSILDNLLTNAVKYNRDGGTVDVRIRGEGERVVMEVRDTGIGLEAADAARLFGEFVRIRNERTREIVGSGLGLAIVKMLAELYGGTATVASTPGAGSTFTVTLGKRQGGKP